jgi:F-type H+-transporting ATPase subunit a
MFSLFAESKLHVSLPAETIFHVGPIAVTNSMLLGALGYAIVIGVFVWMAWAVNNRPRNRFFQFIMWVFESLFATVEQVMGDKKLARKLAPLAITMFFLIIVNYWSGILPFVGPITYNGVPLFRGLVADLNVTFSLAIITMVTAQIYAIRSHGAFGNLGRYFRNPIKNPAGAFEGILELIAEFSRLVGLSFRLFGNVFAGEVLLVVVGYLTQYLAPLTLPPFMVFELFIGAIQAYVFFMLTVVFISLGTMHHDSPSDHSPADTKRTVKALTGE